MLKEAFGITVHAKTKKVNKDWTREYTFSPSVCSGILPSYTGGSHVWLGEGGGFE